MKTSTLPPQLGAGPFLGSAAVAAGLLTKAMLRTAAWRRLLPDVYIRSSRYAPDDHRMWCEAARLICPEGAVFGGWSAAYLWGIDLLPPEVRVWISMPTAARMRRRHRLVYKRTPLEAVDIARVADLPVTTPLRTAFDLGRYLPRTDALVALDALCSSTVPLSELRSLVDRRRSWPWLSRLEGLLALVEPLAESPMETRTRLLLLDAGLPPLVAQYEVRTADGSFVGRVDLAYPRWRIAIEYEGDHHRERVQFQHDVARAAALRDAGWLVLRFTADDILRHPDNAVRQVRAAIEERR